MSLMNTDGKLYQKNISKSHLAMYKKNCIPQRVKFIQHRYDWFKTQK